MSWISAVSTRFRLWFSRRAADARMEEEFRLHLQLETEKNLRAGLSPADARRQAERAFGNIRRHREAMRLGRGTGFIDRLAADARYALRGFQRAPGFTAVAVLTLALGIGATTTIFSATKAILLAPLPYADADRLVVVYAQRPEEGATGINVSYPDYRDWKTSLRSFERMGLFNRSTATLSGEGEAERLNGAELSADLLPTLGVEPLLGRGFLPEEEVRGADRVVLLGHGVWRRRFGGDPSIVGRTVEVDGEPSTVVGVMPPGFRFPYSGELWKPLAPEDHYYRRNRVITGAVGRLAEGASVSSAGREMARLSRALERAYPESNHGWAGELVPLREDVFGSFRSAVLLLFGGVALLLFTICGNLAGLSLARGAGRGRDLAVRAALGAGRGRLVRQLLTESGLLALAGGLLGVAASFWGIGLFRRVLSDRIPPFVSLGPDPWVFGFAFLITASVALLFGLLPALRGSRVDPAAELREGGRAEIGGGARLRSGLVIAEVALAVALLIGSGLLIKSLDSVARIDLVRCPAYAHGAALPPGSRLRLRPPARVRARAARARTGAAGRPGGRGGAGHALQRLGRRLLV